MCLHGGARGRAYSVDLRWRIIWMTWLEERSAPYIAKTLYISKATVRRVRRCFEQHQDVVEPHDSRFRGRLLVDPELDRILMKMLLDEPEGTMLEAYAKFCTETGMDVHYSTVLRAAKRLGFTRGALRGFAAARDAEAALEFKAMIVSRYLPEQLMFIDETAKDPRDMNRTFGWALRGRTPMASKGMLPRGLRRSALCGLDIKGFVNWYIITGTFKKVQFLEAVRTTVLPHMEPFPGKRSVLILDNASIHHGPELRAMVEAKNCILHYTPPYCFDCTPLDNGAFGWVRRYLQKRKELLSRNLTKALHAAFNAVQPRHARSFFKNCLYL